MNASAVYKEAECKPWQKYYPKYAVAIAVCCDQYGGYEYISTPHCGHDEGYHVEEILIIHLARTRQLEDVENIYITYSPCSSCTTLLLDTFRLYKKPNIKFLCIYGEPGTRKHEGAIRSLKLLIQDRLVLCHYCETERTRSSKRMLVHVLYVFTEP